LNLGGERGKKFPEEERREGEGNREIAIDRTIFLYRATGEGGKREEVGYYGEGKRKKREEPSVRLHLFYLLLLGSRGGGRRKKKKGGLTEGEEEEGREMDSA